MLVKPFIKEILVNLATLRKSIDGARISPVASSIGNVCLSKITIDGRLFPMAFTQANNMICALSPIQYADGFFVPLSNTLLVVLGLKENHFHLN